MEKRVLYLEGLKTKQKIFVGMKTI